MTARTVFKDRAQRLAAAGGLNVCDRRLGRIPIPVGPQALLTGIVGIVRLRRVLETKTRDHFITSACPYSCLVVIDPTWCDAASHRGHIWRTSREPNLNSCLPACTSCVGAYFVFELAEPTGALGPTAISR